MYNITTPYISPNFPTEEYLNLNLTINSDDETFEKAIKMFEDRIKGRFLEQINLLKNDCYKNGFSIMALECLLVETFAQFYMGLEDTIGVSQEKYVDFLMNRLTCFRTKTIANKFYSYIRCGILHQAQTKPRSGLTIKNQKTISYQNGFLLVSVDGFVSEMDNYFISYCESLKDCNQKELRENFIKKMDFICKR